MFTRISRLRCEYLENPLGIDQFKPRLSWNMETDRRGARQVAYQIKVASSFDTLKSGGADVWDSGRTESDISIHIEYAGVPLISRMTCHWHVQVWDEQGDTVVSEPARWSMGLLQAKDWQAQWIAADSSFLEKAEQAIAPTLTEPGTPPWFRKAFVIDSSIQRATLYASARGLFECQLNGQRVGENLFAPEWTDYDKRIQYRSYDVTPMLQSGENAIGAVLGDGWYSGYVG
jgi:alpha-L-rhamnosidase